MTHKLEKNKNMATKDVTVGGVNKRGINFFRLQKKHMFECEIYMYRSSEHTILDPFYVQQILVAPRAKFCCL